MTKSSFPIYYTALGGEDARLGLAADARNSGSSTDSLGDLLGLLGGCSDLALGNTDAVLAISFISLANLGNVVRKG